MIAGLVSVSALCLLRLGGGKRVDVRIVPADANDLFAIGSERGGHFGNWQ